MGTTAFALLQAAELGVATGIFGMTPAQYLARFSTGYGAIGLLAQALFALFPLLTNRRDHARPD